VLTLRARLRARLLRLVLSTLLGLGDVDHRDVVVLVVDGDGVGVGSEVLVLLKVELRLGDVCDQILAQAGE
jgi:hypothetical protein